MAETLKVNGLDATDDAVAELSHALVDGYEAARGKLETTLALLAEDARLYQSVMTGNLRAVARIKVEVFGLAPCVDLEAGAYGEDGHNRAELVHRAQTRAGAIAGTAFPNDLAEPLELRSVLDAVTTPDSASAR